MSQNKIEEVIIKLFGENGTFIEAGGSDPIDQNNTYKLEKYYGWTGMAVEPNTQFNKSYMSVRPKTILENYALVSFDHKEKTITGNFSIKHMGGYIRKMMWSNVAH